MEKFYNRLAAVLTVAGLSFMAAVALGFDKCQADELLRKEAIEAVYKIQNGESSCSSIAIDVPDAKPGITFFLTAKHCISQKPSGMIIDVETKDMSETTSYIPYAVVAQSPTLDIAMISTNYPKAFIKAKIANELLANEGDTVWAVGYPLGQTRTTTVGIMGQTEVVMTPLGEFNSFYHASPALERGMSGGGLFQKGPKGYELIGINSMKTGVNDFMNSFVTLKDIKIAMGS